MSVCTLCKGRLFQLEQVLKANLESCYGFNVQFVIVDFGSDDGLHEWLRSHFDVELRSRRITYYELLDDIPFHISVGKNFAHRLADGDLLLNLDADNFVGNMVPLIETHWKANSILHFGAGKLGDGTWGRIGLSRQEFYSLGGYDESFAPAAYHEDDLLARAAATGLRVERIAADAGAIQNRKSETMRFFGGVEAKWWTMLELNRARSLSNLRSGAYVANRTGFTAASFRDNFGERVSLSSGVTR